MTIDEFAKRLKERLAARGIDVSETAPLSSADKEVIKQEVARLIEEEVQ